MTIYDFIDLIDFEWVHPDGVQHITFTDNGDGSFTMSDGKKSDVLSLQSVLGFLRKHRKGEYSEIKKLYPEEIL